MILVETFSDPLRLLEGFDHDLESAKPGVAHSTASKGAVIRPSDSKPAPSLHRPCVKLCQNLVARKTWLPCSGDGGWVDDSDPFRQQGKLCDGEGNVTFMFFPIRQPPCFTESDENSLAESGVVTLLVMTVHRRKTCSLSICRLAQLFVGWWTLFLQ